MSTTETYSPGELVHARGREWIVLGVGEALRLRPLTGSEQEAETLIPELRQNQSPTQLLILRLGIAPEGGRRLSCCGMPSDYHYDVARDPFAVRARSTLSRAPISWRRS